jgi:anti-sigma regulatory factor (Ser/Thr protein kinase)
VEWALDARDVSAQTDLRREIDAYLRRHGDVDADFNGASLIVAELVSNALRHAGGVCWVSLDWSSENPILRVYDLGPNFDLRAELPDMQRSGGRGLFIASAMSPQLVATRRRVKGNDVRAVLPVRRRATDSISPPRRRINVLPSLDEAQPGGGFGRETFLRALVVQLANAIEAQQGASGAEAAVAQVGIDIGGQMEAEYREAKGIEGPLDAAALADCFVRLKHAIDGRFSVVEATPDRVVLENTRCPFGEAVRLAPALCRMTSAVFGGIAAANVDGDVAVTLEERIAIGDPHCRVTVDLRARPEHQPWEQRYQSPPG